MNIPAIPLTEAELAEVEFGKQLISSLVGSTITTVGSMSNGDIYIGALKGGAAVEMIVGKDELGEITVYGVDREVTNG